MQGEGPYLFCLILCLTFCVQKRKGELSKHKIEKEWYKLLHLPERLGGRWFPAQSPQAVCLPGPGESAEEEGLCPQFGDGEKRALVARSPPLRNWQSFSKPCGGPLVPGQMLSALL